MSSGISTSVVLSIWTLLLSAVTSGQPVGLSHGPLAASVTSTSAKIWARTSGVADNPGVAVKYRPVGGTYTSTPVQQTDGTKDLTAEFLLNPLPSGLSPNTIYEYTVVVNGSDQASARFKTFPGPLTSPSFKFGLLSDITGKSDVPVLSLLALENLAFVVILGDYDHRDPGDQGTNETDVLAAVRAMHRDVRDPNNPLWCSPNCPGDELQANVFSLFPVANIWDDHDYCCNNASGEIAGYKKTATFKGHQEYWPSYTLANTNEGAGLWHMFKFGKDVEIYMLDLRFKRTDYLATDTCTGGVPIKSMLAGQAVTGQDQKAWLKEKLAVPGAKWRFLISSTPWNRTLPKDDAWKDYQCEQDELLNYIVGQGIEGVVLISGDIHTGGAIDDGTNSLCPELSVPKTNPLYLTCGGMEHDLCGDWKCESAGTFPCISKSPTRVGFGIVEINEADAKLKTITTDGGGVLAGFSQTLSPANVCTAP